MTIRWRVVGTALLLPVVLASCAAAPGATEAPGAPEEPGTVTNGGRPVTSRPASATAHVPASTSFSVTARPALALMSSTSFAVHVEKAEMKWPVNSLCTCGSSQASG